MPMKMRRLRDLGIHPRPSERRRHGQGDVQAAGFARARQD